MFDIKVFGGKAVTRRVRPIGEELEPRCLRFYTKFPGNWSVTVERKRTKHIWVCFSFTKTEATLQKIQNYILVSKNRQ